MGGKNSQSHTETATIQQIDLFAAATERTIKHVNEQIDGMNAKLDAINRRLGDMETKVSDMVLAVAKYHREGMQALNELNRSSGSIRMRITELEKANKQRRKEFRILREEHTAEADSRLRAEATITSRMDFFRQLIARAIANASAEERELLQQLQVQNRNTEQLVARLHMRMDDAERPRAYVEPEPHRRTRDRVPAEEPPPPDYEDILRLIRQEHVNLGLGRGRDLQAHPRTVLHQGMCHHHIPVMRITTSAAHHLWLDHH